MIIWLQFIVSSGLVILGGFLLAKNGKELGDRYGLSDLWIGFIFLAAITSIPELSTAIGAVWIAETVSLRGSYVSRLPVPENAPPDDKPINDSEIHEEWFGVDPNGGGGGMVLITAGAALNPLHPRLSSLEGMERRIFYLNPGSPKETTGLMIHQHALCLDPTPLPEPGATAGQAAEQLLRDGRVRDVKHVLDDSKFINVRAAFLHYSDIREIR